MFPYRDRYAVHHTLPATGVERSQILAEVAEMAAQEDESAMRGQISGSIYSGDSGHYEFLNEVFAHFSHANVLQRDVYPSATRFEGEIIAMTADMLHAPGPYGVVTSGGTESLMNPLLVYREWGRERGITAPNLVMPSSAHPAFLKGAHYFGIEVRQAPLTAEFVGDVSAMESMIDDNTVALIGSAGSYPHGAIDPIERLSEIAVDRGINLHVDGCLGGFVLAFAEDCGLAAPCWDFRLPGVTSISADTHKYGFALKGTSVLVYRSAELRHLQYFKVPDWSGGLYASPGMSGSRSGGIIAAAWAAMISLGREGYVRIAGEIFDTARRLRQAISAHPQLRILGDPLFNVAFTTTDESGLDIFSINDSLAAQGWRLNGLQAPRAVHFCVTRPQTKPGVIDRFAAALDVAVRYATDHRGQPARSGATYGASGPSAPVADVEAGMDWYMDASMSVPGSAS